MTNSIEFKMTSTHSVPGSSVEFGRVHCHNHGPRLQETNSEERPNEDLWEESLEKLRWQVVLTDVCERE